MAAEERLKARDLADLERELEDEIQAERERPSSSQPTIWGFSDV
jgi:hypothetical protein